MRRMPTILLAEDEAAIAETILYALRAEGFTAEHVLLGGSVVPRLRQGGIDLVILDVGLPDRSGFEVCRELRTTSAVPVVFLTARNDEIDRVLGLELGADDYIVKPFEPRELVARVRSILRRYQRAPIAEAVSERSSARFAGWVFDTSQHALTAPDGRELSLSAAEAGLLATLVRRPNKILSREQLLGERDVDPFDRSIDVRISRLRRKLDDDPQNPRLIKTVYGAGYLFSSQVEWV